MNPIDLETAYSSTEPQMRTPRMAHGRTWVRRSIGIALMAIMCAGVYWLIFHTSVLAPVFELAAPIEDGINWIIADPQRAWMGAALVVIPHIGLYYMFFEER